MKYQLFFISFLLLNLQVIGQDNENIIVYGKIVDPAGKPVEGVSVSDINSAVVCVSNVYGFYKITLKPQPTEIKFTYIGFKTVKKNISSSKIKKAVNGQIIQDVKLEQETYVLSSVNVSGTPYELVYQNPKAWVEDFDFASDTSILLLIKEDKKQFLRLIDNNGKALLNYNIDIPEAKLTNDCFGNIHILTHDSVYQVYIYDTLGIHIYAAISRKLFNAKLYPCVYADSANLLFRNYKFFGQSASLDLINKKSKYHTLLYSVTNENNIEIVKGILNEINGLVREASIEEDDSHKAKASSQANIGDLGNVNNSTSLENPLEGFEDIQEKTNKKLFDLENTLQLYSKPVQLNVYGLQDSIYVFDFFNYKLIVFKNDSIEKRSLNFDKDKFDLEHTKTYVDYEHKRIFLMNTNVGIAYFKELELSDLSTKSEFMISEHIYPQKIKIRGNYVYYLFGGVIDEGEKYFYREKIKK